MGKKNYYFCKYNMSLNVEGNLGKKIKLEGIVLSWVVLLYGTPPDITFGRRTSISKSQLFEKYGLCNKRPSPKHLKIGKDLEDVEMEKFFGKPVSRNAYEYCHINMRN